MLLSSYKEPIVPLATSPSATEAALTRLGVTGGELGQDSFAAGGATCAA